MMLGRASRLVRRPLVRDASKVASTFDDMIPMTIADRIEQQAVTAGTFENLSGSGKPEYCTGKPELHLSAASGIVICPLPRASPRAPGP